MEYDDQLIHRILLGDDDAFTTLMKKHYKSIHYYIWKIVKDFHIAEDVTQETFIQAHRKLSTLKDPNQFVGWLYAIANRLSINWIQRSKTSEASLDNIPQEEIDEFSYSRHILEQREIISSEHRSNVIKKILEILPEDERIVMILYYLDEMTTREISESLGVSVNTITSRLQRARKRSQQIEIGDTL